MIGQNNAVVDERDFLLLYTCLTQFSHYRFGNRRNLGEGAQVQAIDFGIKRSAPIGNDPRMASGDDSNIGFNGGHSA